MRNTRIDMLRGIAVILVMAGHGIGLLIQKGLVSPNSGGGIYDAIYSFHMPLFFLISGYVYQCNHEKAVNIVLRNVITFYIPYLFLSYSYWVERVAASRILGIQLAQNEYVGGIKLCWAGEGLTWFLLSMMLVKVLFSLLDTYVSDIFAFSVFSVFFWLSYIFPQYKILDYLQWGIFFCFGYAMKKYCIEKMQKSIIYICCVNLLFIGIDRYFLCGLDKFVKVCIGMSVFVIFVYARKIRDIKLLALFGKSSMVIYMVHGLSQYLCYYIISEILHIRIHFVLLSLMIVVQLLIAFLIVILYTRVKYLRWMQIIFYPYKYIMQKRNNNK